MKSNRILLEPGEQPELALPPPRGKHEPGDGVLCSWQGHPDDVSLGRWDHYDAHGRVQRWVTRVVPTVLQVVMTPRGRAVEIGATVYGFDYQE